ncbi:hypothetical protein R70006_04961 [Paraburkholderia domus]|uniref:ADP-ribosyltransferase-containing protein n=1 Tax=Paraburkholderia domus TaxID=2793075 RepID=UPI001911C0CB|nr:hypothetical protein [Paraburkholderia domus]MBK5051803.1 hypothetical protein [Burkholderia sp. R-70006]CAE6793522.1 hypothetical protein R70006_04961 [Paraburkholderia domus]
MDSTTADHGETTPPIADYPRLRSLVLDLAEARGASFEEALHVLAEDLQASGFAPAEAARRNSAFMLGFRTRHGLTMPVSERAPWQMTGEEFEEAGFAIRRGPIDPAGAYFATPGSSTYHDTGTDDESVNRYDLGALRIADTDDKEIALAIIREAFNEPDRTDEERDRLQGLLADYAEDCGCIGYKDCDELVLSWAARRLGWDGILVWENDDIGGPSSVFVWALDRVDWVARNHRLAVLQAIDEGLPVAPHIMAEVGLDDPNVRFVLADAIAAARSPLAHGVAAVEAQISAGLEAVGIDDLQVRAGMLRQIRSDAREGAVTAGLPGAISAQARELAHLYSRQKGGHTHRQGAGTTAAELKTAIDYSFGAGFSEQLFSGRDFRLVEKETDLPPHMRHPDGGVAGVYDNASGQTFLVAEWITAESVRGVLLHEIGVHYGMRRMLGARADRLIAQAKRLADSGDPAAVAARAKVPASTHAANVDEEILSHLVGDLASQKLGIVMRARAQLKAFIFRLGADVALGAADMLMLAEGSLRRAAAPTDKPRFTLLGRAKALAKKFLSASRVSASKETQIAPRMGAICDADQLDQRAVDLAANRLRVPAKTVAGVLTEDVELLRDRDRFSAPVNCMEVRPFPEHELGTPKIAYWNADYSEAYVDHLAEFDPHRLATAEHEQGIRKHPTFARYVQMFRDGHMPPYIHVFEDPRGNLVASNRRRTLAAQEANVRIRGWHGIENRETGLPLKYRDVVHAYVDAVHELSATVPDAAGSRKSSPQDLLFLRQIAPGSQHSDAFQAWFRDSAIQYPDGSPIVAYHGTGADFSVFSRERLGETTSAADAREGFFFAADASAADEFAWKDGERGCIMPVYLKMEAPYVTDFVVRASNGREFAEILRQARADGHDGVAAFGEFLGKETSVFVVFDPAQIKSALGNSGTYDAANPDIRFSLADHEHPSVQKIEPPVTEEAAAFFEAPGF